MRRRGTRHKAFSKTTIKALVPSLAVGLFLLYILWSQNLMSLLPYASLLFFIFAALYGLIAAFGPHSNTILFFAGKTPDELKRETTVRFFLILFVAFTIFAIFYQLIFLYFK